MLPSALLISRRHGDTIIPKRLPLNHSLLALAQGQIETFQHHLGKTQGDLDRTLSDLEGDSPQYRLTRGLAHLLKNHFANFDIRSPLEPMTLRRRVFHGANPPPLTAEQRQRYLETLALELGQELGREVLTAEIEQGLYADLPENRILTEFEAPTPETLLHRYNLSQVQGIFYRAHHVVLQAYRNDPGEYKLLFRYLKLFQLMAYIEGDADLGFTITIDGPTSLFKASTRYGLALAKLIPALLHVRRWYLQAQLEDKDVYSGQRKLGQFELDHECGLVSHYPAGQAYDSMLEASFAQGWQKLGSAWQLEREVELIPLPGSVMIPDFRLVHADGRVYLLEIVGYWRPEYLKKKFAQVQRAGIDNLILAISERLNLEKAGVNFRNTPARLVWFKDKLKPQSILSLLEPEVNV